MASVGLGADDLRPGREFFAVDCVALSKVPTTTTTTAA